MPYIKSLDTIRAIAVFLVMFSHWNPGPFETTWYIGGIGVDLFFVLSGFLITGILLDASDNTDVKPIHTIRNFMIRRILRIFPVYYFTLFAIWCCRNLFVNHFMDESLYYFTYTINFRVFLHNQWDGNLSHLWSLAVEEQFYLFWPWIIVFMPRKYFPVICAIGFFFAIASTFIISAKYPGHYMVSIIPTTCLDCFCAGGLMAYLLKYKKSVLPKVYSWMQWLAPLCFICMLLGRYHAVPEIILPRTLITFSGVYLILFCILSQKHPVHKYIMSNRHLQYAGKISYGIYLFHYFVPLLTEGFIHLCEQAHIIVPLLSYHIKSSAAQVAQFIEYMTITLCLAWASYNLLETPFLRLKYKFSYAA